MAKLLKIKGKLDTADSAEKPQSMVLQVLKLGGRQTFYMLAQYIQPLPVLMEHLRDGLEDGTILRVRAHTGTVYFQAREELPVDEIKGD